MSSERGIPTAPLADAATFINGDRSSNYPGQDDYIADGIPFISATDLRDGSVQVQSVKRITSVAFARLRAGKIEPDDILFCLRGSIGKMAFVRPGETGAIASSLVIVRARSNADPKYLYFFLCSAGGQQSALSLNNGSAQPNLSVQQLQRVRLPLPKLSVQREISAMLSYLDDRIALLRETNATLEAIAQALFKSWFIDFDPVQAKQQGLPPAGMDEATAALFPDSFDELHSGLVPKGWKFDAIGEIVEGIYDGPHATPAEADDGPIFLGIKNLTGSGLDMTDIRHINEGDWAQWTRRVAPRAGDIVFSYEATLGFFALIPPGIRCCLGRRLALIRPIEINGCGHFLFHQFVAAPFQQLLAKHTIQGATVNRIALKQFPSYPVLNPPEELKLAFDRRVSDLWLRIHANQAQAQTLATLRDTLLPRLISGQIRLPEVEAELETV